MSAPSPSSAYIARSLRYTLTLALMDAGRPMTVGELTDAPGDAGRAPEGRPGKVISDALRWEVRRGRVRRLRRGVYVSGHLPRSTQCWMRDQILRWEHASDVHKLSSVRATTEGLVRSE
jgi:hypothetical protein